MGYTIFRPEELRFQAPSGATSVGSTAPLSDALHEMRANISPAFHPAAGARAT